MVNFLNSTTYPRGETFIDMLTFTMFSTYKFRSLSTMLITLNTIVFIITLIHGGIVQGGYLLEPTQEVFYCLIETLFDLGMSYPYFTRNDGELHRLVLSLFLYSNFVNFITCQIGWAIYGSYVEKLVGWKMIWMVGVVSGLAGTILSCCISPMPHVNGSSLPCSFIGFLLGYLLIKWDQWDYSGSGRWQMLGWLIFGAGCIFLEYKWFVLCDEVANFGSTVIGMLCGFVLIASFDKQASQSDHRCTSFISIALIISYFFLSLGYFYKYSHPTLLAN